MFEPTFTEVVYLKDIPVSTLHERILKRNRPGE